MKVKIGDITYDANDQPIMVILNQGERKQIANMDPEAIKYCQFPDSCDVDAIREWMQDPKAELAS
jgi:hypothetical protein